MTTWNGVVYDLPADRERGWGPSVRALLEAIAATAMTTTPNLTAELDLGDTWGIRSKWFRSQTPTVAAAGILRLGRADRVSWRNEANSADLALGPASDNILEYNSIDIVDVSTAQTLTNKTISGGTVTGTIAGSATFSGGVTLTAPVVTASPSVAPTPINFGASAAAAATTVAFLRPGYVGAAADTTEVFMVMPIACKLSNLYVFGTGNSTGGTTTVTVRKNGVDQALTCTVSSGAATANDTTHSVTFAAGDRLSIKIVSNSGVSPVMTQPSACVMMTQA